jgi:hypothetical protein
MNVGVAKRDDGCSGHTNPPKECLAHREPRVAHAWSRHDAHLMAARDQARHHRHDEGDVAATLKHRDKDSGRLSHSSSVRRAFQPLV